MTIRGFFHMASCAIAILGILLSRPDDGLPLAIWVMLIAIYWMLDEIRKGVQNGE